MLAEVGNDIFGDDPTVARLEDLATKLLRKAVLSLPLRSGPVQRWLHDPPAKSSFLGARPIPEPSSRSKTPYSLFPSDSNPR
ncbi:MAG: hypothetical protein ABF381_08115 [Akkermansiaceae bacterium]